MIKEFPPCDQRWSAALWEHAKELRFLHDEDKTLYEQEIEKYFFRPFHASILQSIPSVFVKKFLSAELYKARHKTALELISDTVFTRYLEGRQYIPSVTISEKHLKKFQITQGEFLMHFEDAFYFFKDFMEIRSRSNGTLLTLTFIEKNLVCH